MHPRQRPLQHGVDAITRPSPLPRRHFLLRIKGPGGVQQAQRAKQVIQRLQPADAQLTKMAQASLIQHPTVQIGSKFQFYRRQRPVLL
jgi:hypothetical protein